jgi:hypothetical protein
VVVVVVVYVFVVLLVAVDEPVRYFCFADINVGFEDKDD